MNYTFLEVTKTYFIFKKSIGSSIESVSKERYLQRAATCTKYIRYWFNIYVNFAYTVNFLIFLQHNVI